MTDAREGPEEPETPRIYWDFRDDKWTARVQTKDGRWLQASRGIKRRQKADNLDCQAAKKAAYHDVEELVAAVRAGEVTKRDTDETD